MLSHISIAMYWVVHIKWGIAYQSHGLALALGCICVFSYSPSVWVQQCKAAQNCPRKLTPTLLRCLRWCWSSEARRMSCWEPPRARSRAAAASSNISLTNTWGSASRRAPRRWRWSWTSPGTRSPSRRGCRSCQRPCRKPRVSIGEPHILIGNDMIDLNKWLICYLFWISHFICWTIDIIC